MSTYDRPDQSLKYLRLLSQQFPTQQSVFTEIINLQAILNLPKGTEHFMRRKKGTCGDCAQAGSCGGACAGCSTRRGASCPACEGVDRVAEKLSRNANGR